MSGGHAPPPPPRIAAPDWTGLPGAGKQASGHSGRGDDIVLRGFMASSADGFVADIDGSVDFLKPFEDVDSGYDAFIDQVQTVVLGRSTYDQIPGFGVGWPYPGKRGLVVTSRPLGVTYDGVERWTGGVAALADHVSRLEGDCWVVGGPSLQAALLDLGAIERLELFIVPVLLGDGLPLFPRRSGGRRHLELAEARALDRGMVKVDYRIPKPA